MLLTVLRRWSGVVLYFVLLCGLYHGALNVLKSSRALCSRLSICFSILITLLGKRGLVLFFSYTCLFVLRVFLLFLFLLVSRVGCGL